MTTLFNTTRTPIEIVNYFLFYFCEEYSVPHMKGEYTTPLPILVSIGIYLLVVLHYLPKYMENRKPYDLKRVMKYYNLTNMFANAMLFSGGLYFMNWGYDCWFCQQGIMPKWLAIRSAELFGFLKIFDFLDTIFFILRKKDNQVTALHVIHHCIMPFTVYCGLKFDGTPSAGFTLLVNSFGKSNHSKIIQITNAVIFFLILSIVFF